MTRQLINTPQPHTARPHYVVAGLFLLATFGQRLSIPGAPALPLALLAAPIIITWGLATQRITINPHRLQLYFLITTLSGLTIAAQHTYLTHEISTGSWAVLLFTLALLTFTPTYTHETQRHATHTFLIHTGTLIGALSTAFIITQLIGLPYLDVIDTYLPDAIVLDGFANAYPIEWGSTIHKSNAWIGLEPSFISFALGLTFLATLTTPTHWFHKTLITTGLLATVSGSGLFLITIGATALYLKNHPTTPRRTILLTLTTGAALIAFTPLRPLIGNRILEFREPGTSASLRAIDPYTHTWPEWLTTTTTYLLGYGAGHTQDIADATGISGLFAPTPARMLFDYGLIAGGLMLTCFTLWLLHPARNAITIAATASFLLLQPTSPPLLLTALCLSYYLTGKTNTPPPTTSKAQHHDPQHPHHQPQPQR